MPTITPPLPPQPPTVTPTPAAVLTVTQPPVELARLTIGGLLEATVASQAGKDAYLLQTSIGQLSVLSTVALPKDANLVLQILSLSPQALLQVNVIDAANPNAAPRTGHPSGRLSELGNQAVTGDRPLGPGKSAPLPPLAVGIVIRAALVRPLTLPASGPFGNPSVPPLATAPSGSPQPVASAGPDTGKPPVPASGLPGPTPRSGIAAPSSRVPGSPSSPPGTTPTASPATGGAATRPAGLVFPAGTQVSFKITGIQLPSPVANNVIPALGGSGPAALGAGKVLTGVITGTTASGHPVVQTEAGIFSLNAQSSSPRGSIITLEVATAPKPLPPVTTSSAHPGGGASDIFADRRWPPLEEAFQVLHDAAPAASRQLVNTVLPRPDVHLTAGLVFFLSALRGGDLRQWFGESNMQILEKSRPDLANRLSNDFNMLGKVADEPVGADWRVALIPVNTGAQIEQIRMLLRHHGNDDDESGSKDQGTRFILDVDLSRLGRLQLDGLVRDKGRKLDLIIRSGDVLDADSRNEIRRIFSEAADLTGFTGSVGFQESPPNFINVPDPLAARIAGLIV